MALKKHIIKMRPGRFRRKNTFKKVYAKYTKNSMKKENELNSVFQQLKIDGVNRGNKGETRTFL